RSAGPPPLHDPITSSPGNLAVRRRYDIGFVLAGRPLAGAAAGIRVLTPIHLVRLVQIHGTDGDHLVDTVDCPDWVGCVVGRWKAAQPSRVVVASRKDEDHSCANAEPNQVEIG